MATSRNEKLNDKIVAQEERIRKYRDRVGETNDPVEKKDLLQNIFLDKQLLLELYRQKRGVCMLV